MHWYLYDFLYSFTIFGCHKRCMEFSFEFQDFLHNFFQNSYIPNLINAAGIIHSNSTIAHFRITADASFGTFSVTPAIDRIAAWMRTTNIWIIFPNPRKKSMTSLQNTFCWITDSTVVINHIKVSISQYPHISLHCRLFAWYQTCHCLRLSSVNRFAFWSVNLCTTDWILNAFCLSCSASAINRSSSCSFW